MAIVHRATISPTKLELTTRWLDQQPWGGAGEVEVLAGYRFDDPAGEVGVEALLVRRDGRLFQLPLSYRGEPLESGALVSTMEHSVLGRRWIYLATSDPVGRECYVRSLRGEQQQAGVEVWDGDTLVARRDPVVRLSLDVGPGPDDDGASDGDRVAVADVGGRRLRIPLVLAGEIPGARRMVGSWADLGPVVLATLS